MKTLLISVMVLAVAIMGCNQTGSWPAVDSTQGAQTAPTPSPGSADAARESSSNSISPCFGVANSDVEASPTAAAARKPEELLLEGTIFSSGWMGDAESSTGPLSFEWSSEDPFSGPTCEKWSYRVSSASEQGWIGVAYQGPTENNWGDRPGLNLSARGYRVLTFMARGQHGGERIQIRSGA